VCCSYSGSSAVYSPVSPFPHGCKGYRFHPPPQKPFSIYLSSTPFSRTDYSSTLKWRYRVSAKRKYLPDTRRHPLSYRSSDISYVSALTSSQIVSISPVIQLFDAMWLRRYATSQRVSDLRPNEMKFFNLLILRAALGPGVHSASNRNEYQKQKKFLGSKARPVRRVVNL
jgi:hypothetical protein